MSQIPFDVLLKTKEGAGVSRPKHTARRQKPEKRSAQRQGEPNLRQNQSSNASAVEEQGAAKKKKKGKHMPKEISSKRTYNPFREEDSSLKRYTVASQIKLSSRLSLSLSLTHTRLTLKQKY